jgi:hypothetical protein
VTNDSDSFIQEVDEGLREERLMSQARRYAPWAIGGLIAVLAGIGGWQLWRGEMLKSAHHQSDAFAAALQQAAGGDIDAAKAAFAPLSTRGPQAYQIMARMEHAALLQSQGDLQAALTEFDTIAADARDPVMRSSAQLRAAYLVADTQDFQAVQARVQPIIDGGGQFSFLAQELLAVEAWEAGQTDIARDTLENMRLAFDTPQSVRQRAELALAVLGPAPAPAADDAAEPARQPTEGESK